MIIYSECHVYILYMHIYVIIRLTYCSYKYMDILTNYESFCHCCFNSVLLNHSLYIISLPMADSSSSVPVAHISSPMLIFLFWLNLTGSP